MHRETAREETAKRVNSMEDGQCTDTGMTEMERIKGITFELTRKITMKGLGSLAA
jgi:hypothetical protein